MNFKDYIKPLIDVIISFSFNEKTEKILEKTGIFMVILCFIVSFIYILMTIFLTIDHSIYISPLNVNTLHYKATQAYNKFTNGQTFNMYIFLILSVIGFIASLLSIIVNVSPSNNKNEQLLVIVLCFGFGFTLFVLQCMFGFGLVNNNYIAPAKKALQDFNDLVISHIYKNPSFLKLIYNSQNISIVGVNNTIKSCLATITQSNVKITSKDIANAFYTLSIYAHLDKIVQNTSNIKQSDIFSIFDNTAILTKQCKVVEYLQRNGTFIEDISETLLRPNIGSKIDPNILKEAIDIYRGYIKETNIAAGNVYTKMNGAYSGFIAIIVLLFVAFLIHLMLIIYNLQTINITTTPKDPNLTN
jgi:hypothetical protein